MTWWKFEIPLTPKVKKNSRPIFRNKKSGKPFLGKDESLREYERDALLILQSQRSCCGLREPLSGILEARFLFEFRDRCPADTDNLISTAQDVAATAKIILNDKLIKRVVAEVVEDTGRPDRTLMYFRKKPKPGDTAVPTGAISLADAKNQIRSILK